MCRLCVRPRLVVSVAGFVPSVLIQLHYPLGLKWDLSIRDLQQPLQGIRVFWERALTNLRKARDRVAQRCDAQRREVTFRVGDLVLVRRYPLRSKVLKRSAKLENRWSNPMVIARL
jgi:hypothetical protein